ENAATSVRLMRRDGTPLDVQTSVDDGSPYTTIPPQVLPDPNLLNRYIRRDGIQQPHSDVATFVAAYLAHVEGQDDVGSVLMEPLVRELKEAGPVALGQQAFLVTNDPAFPQGAARDLARVLHETVIEKDPGIWRSAHWVTVDGAGKKGMPAAARELRELFTRYAEVPEIGTHLAGVYEELKWTAERNQLIRTLAARFPEDKNVLEQLLELHEALGEHAEADAVAKRLRALDPDSEVELDRALQRRDYDKALQELKRLAALRPDRKPIADRIEAVMASRL
ncbi:MAG: hypothetical protein MUF54_23800, partial [Polyangiaceae bacterium]|nr:hypothetical protein [Polyangiaceae bacterium]